MRAPNGFFLNDLLWYETNRDGEAIVSKGFEIQMQDLSAASVQTLNNFTLTLANLLYKLPEGFKAQVQWGVDNDYREALESYHGETERDAGNAWVSFTRNERFFRHHEQMERGGLRRERLFIYFTRRIETGLSRLLKTKRGVLDNLAVLLNQQLQAFQNIAHSLNQLFGAVAKVVPLDDAGHFAHYRNFLNPSLRYQKREQMLEEFNPNYSIQELCWRSDGLPAEEASFHFDGQYHSIFVVERWPRESFPGNIQRLTGLSFNDYCVTVNIYPLDVQREIDREEKMIERLEGDYRSERKHSLLTAKQKKERKVDELASGHLSPLNALYVVRVWDASQEGLVSKTNAVRTALADMGMQAYHATRSTTAQNIFYQTWPGAVESKYRGWDLYGNNLILACNLPFSSTFTGHLDQAEAIYNGAVNNLVGIRTFVGAQPQHAILFGGTGAGKSAFMCDLLSQTEHRFGKTVLIEEGLSYGIYTKLQGCDPIIIQPNGELSLNYFDTQGLPLSPEQTALGSALCLRMVGLSNSEDTNKLRLAQIGSYINQLFKDAQNDWARRNEERMPELTRRAFALEQYRRQRMADDSTFVDAFTEFRDFEAATADEAQAFLAGFDEGQILEWSKRKEGSQRIEHLTLAYFTPEEYPRHAALYQSMRYGRFAHHREDEINYLADLLETWSAGAGQRGKLFDGVSNIDLDKPVLHFELGKLGQTSSDMKEAAGFLINNVIRQKIMTMPRGVKKRIVFEEVARFMDMPGGDEIVAGGYATYRKYSTWLISVVQAYAQFNKNPDLKKVIRGNSKIFFIMRQSDPGDVADIAQSLGLPDVTQNTIRGYASPEHLPAHDRYSSVTYFCDDASNPVNGTLRNYACREMLLCSSSDGDVFDKRSRELKRYPSTFDGIMDLATQTSDQPKTSPVSR